MWYGGWGGWLAMGVTMVLFWGLVIAAIVAIIYYVSSTQRGGNSTDVRGQGGQGRAEEILAERFARGEIDIDEYQHRLVILRERR
jgi:putative membrane protein